MATEQVLVAADGGGSQTRLWLLDREGRVLGRGQGGTSNPTAAGVAAAVQAIAEAARQAGLELPAGSSPSDGGAAPGRGPVSGSWPAHAVAVAVLALAGVSREPEKSQMREAVGRLFPAAQVVVVHDGVAALMAGTLGEPGVLLLAGTGSLALALGPDGQEVRAGGWGYLLGDEGSGYWIGREAIRAALRAEDGRGPQTSLTRRLCQAAGVGHISDLVGPVHRGEWNRAWIASLARDVMEAALQGDEVASGIIDGAAGELALLVRAVCARAGFLSGLDPVPTVTAGGLFRMGEAWLDRVARALAREAPRARLVGRVEEPVVGAAYLALKAFHQRVPEPVLERLRAYRTGNQ